MNSISTDSASHRLPINALEEIPQEILDLQNATAQIDSLSAKASANTLSQNCLMEKTVILFQPANDLSYYKPLIDKAKSALKAIQDVSSWIHCQVLRF